MGLSLRGQTSGAIDINAPNVAGDNTITLPVTNGAANQFYKNSGTAGIVTHSSMVEDSSGNIGINRTDPDQKLNINGNLEVNAYDSPSGSGGYYTAKGLIIGNLYDAGKSYSGSDDRTGCIWQERGLDLDFATNDTLRMKITYDGKIGIGTDVPSELLHLQSGWTKQILKSTNLNTASSLIFDTHNVNTADFLLGQLAGRWNGNDVAYINFEAGVDTTNKDDGVISFLTSPSGSTPTERLRITPSGDFGFGTASPNNYNNYTTLTLNNTNGGEIDFEVGGTLTADVFTNAGGLFLNTRTAAPIVFGTNNGSSFGERVRVQPTGGISFNGDTATANALDDYEEGTHTTVFTDSGSGTITVSSGNDQLSYIKVGNLVSVIGRPTVGSVSSPTGYLQMTLPFTSADVADAGARSAGSLNLRIVASGYDVGLFSAQIGENSNILTINYGGSTDSTPSGPAMQAGTQIWVSITYRTA